MFRVYRAARATPPSTRAVFASGLEPLPDYSKIPIYGIEDQQNLDSFLHSSMWLDVVKGFTPEEVVEAVRLPDRKTEAWGFKFRVMGHFL